MITKFISFPVFLISLAIGLFYVYTTQSNFKIVQIYPTPENKNKLQYVDYLDNCFEFDHEEIKCTDGINSFPIQG